jgi:beta-ribofuranosylaminobenzene 5'-phosphate synthase
MNDLYSPTQSLLETGVSITAPARLHMGFFDLNGELGRRYGSIGVCLDQPVTEIHAWRSDDGMTAEGPGAPRAISIANHLVETLGLRQGMHMQIVQAIPEHAGLGAGTQMSLAVGLALSRLYDLDLSINDIALHTQRGARSGIGLGTFAHGGVIVDGGRSDGSRVPPVIARADFPEAWRIILIRDNSHAGVHGEAETEAFRALPPFPAEIAAQLCRRVLMQALPALAEHDLTTFGAAIRELQERTGDYFAPAQGGRYASRKVGAVLQWLGEQQVSCLGQSSWGPTGFAILENEPQAQACLQQLRQRFAELEFLLCRGRNAGGILCDIDRRIKN